MIKIPRKFLTAATSVSDLWLTNGHWAILKIMLTESEQAVFATATTASQHLGKHVSEVDQKTIDSIIPRVDLKRWKFTGKAHVTLDGKNDRLEYACGDELTYFTRAYVEMAYAGGRGVQCEFLLGASPTSAFTDEERCFVIMPVVI